MVAKGKTAKTVTKKGKVSNQKANQTKSQASTKTTKGVKTQPKSVKNKRGSGKKLWLIALIVVIVVAAIVAAVVLLCGGKSDELISFDGVEAEAMSRDDGVRIYKGRLDLICRIDTDTLSTDALILPDDEIETISCRTDDIVGNFKLAKGGRIEIEYPKQDQEMADRKTMFYEMYKELLPDKVEAYTRDWHNENGKVTFHRTVEYMNEDGQPQYSIYAPDGGDDYTYLYKFSLYNDKDKLEGIYELTISVDLGDEGRKALDDFEDKADLRRYALRSEMMSTAISPNYEEYLQALVNHSSRYSTMYLKFTGVVRVIEESWLDGDACQLFVGAGGYSDDIWVLGCEINGVSLTEGDTITVIGITDGDGLETFKSKGGTIRTIPRLKAYSVSLDNSQKI